MFIPAYSDDRHVPPGSGPNEASVLYNAMVAPWDSFAVRSLIWYQGEANADELVGHAQSSSYYAAGYQAIARGPPLPTFLRTEPDCRGLAGFYSWSTKLGRP